MFVRTLVFVSVLIVLGFIMNQAGEIISSQSNWWWTGILICICVIFGFYYSAKWYVTSLADYMMSASSVEEKPVKEPEQP